MQRKIIFIGPMGAGKSSLGKRLALHLKWAFCDTDQELANSTGVDIPTIFRREGEQGFRQREQEILRTVLGRPGDAIVACGGGIVLAPENRRLICAQYLVVFLDVSVAKQIERVGNDSNRPLMQAENLVERLSQLRDDRLAFYEGLADIRIETDDDRFNVLFIDLVAKVEAWLRQN